jgi:hypothetical protein
MLADDDHPDLREIARKAGAAGYVVKENLLEMVCLQAPYLGRSGHDLNGIDRTNLPGLLSNCASDLGLRFFRNNGGVLWML